MCKIEEKVTLLYSPSMCTCRVSVYVTEQTIGKKQLVQYVYIYMYNDEKAQTCWDKLWDKEGMDRCLLYIHKDLAVYIQCICVYSSL